MGLFVYRDYVSHVYVMTCSGFTAGLWQLSHAVALEAGRVLDRGPVMTRFGLF